MGSDDDGTVTGSRLRATGCRLQAPSGQVGARQVCRLKPAACRLSGGGDNLPPLPPELRRLFHARSQDADRTGERLHARAFDLRGVVAYGGEAVGRWREALPVTEQAAPVAVERLRHHYAGLHGVPEAVVVQ